MRRKAHGKLTLCLKAKPRIDGVLQFKNIIVPIDLFDMVYLEVSDEDSLETNKEFLPLDQRNTVFKAVNIMRHQYGIHQRFKIRIVKNIPTQSGLGGGSSDAAAVIHMINDLYQFHLDDAQLIDIARQIDEDTPFCLFNKPAIVEGSGDVLTFLPFEMPLYYILVKPPFGISTKSFLKRFNNFNPDDMRFDHCREGLLNNDYQQLVQNIHNDFQKPVIKKYPKLSRVKRHLIDLGLEGVSMTGSGTGMFGLSLDKDQVIDIYSRIVFKYPFVKYGRIQQ